MKRVTYHKPGHLTDAQRNLLELYHLYWMYNGPVLNGQPTHILISNGPINDQNKKMLMLNLDSPIDWWLREFERVEMLPQMAASCA